MTKKVSILARMRDLLLGPRPTHEESEAAKASLASTPDLSSYTVERQKFWPAGLGGAGPS